MLLCGRGRGALGRRSPLGLSGGRCGSGHGPAHHAEDVAEALRLEAFLALLPEDDLAVLALGDKHPGGDEVGVLHLLVDGTEGLVVGDRLEALDDRGDLRVLLRGRSLLRGEVRLAGGLLRGTLLHLRSLLLGGRLLGRGLSVALRGVRLRLRLEGVETVDQERLQRAALLALGGRVGDGHVALVVRRHGDGEAQVSAVARLRAEVPDRLRIVPALLDDVEEGSDDLLGGAARGLLRLRLRGRAVLVALGHVAEVVACSASGLGEEGGRLGDDLVAPRLEGVLVGLGAGVGMDVLDRPLDPALGLAVGGSGAVCDEAVAVGVGLDLAGHRDDGGREGPGVLGGGLDLQGLGEVAECPLEDPALARDDVAAEVDAPIGRAGVPLLALIELVRGASRGVGGERRGGLGDVVGQGGGEVLEGLAHDTLDQVRQLGRGREGTCGGVAALGGVHGRSVSADRGPDLGPVLTRGEVAPPLGREVPGLVVDQRLPLGGVALDVLGALPVDEGDALGGVVPRRPHHHPAIALAVGLGGSTEGVDRSQGGDRGAGLGVLLLPLNLDGDGQGCLVLQGVPEDGDGRIVVVHVRRDRVSEADG